MAPEKILDLVAIFARNTDEYKSAAFNEAMLRQQFINPMFRELGWDMDNTAGYAEAYKDVIHEASLKIGDAMKAPDYCFRIGGTPKFYLEAKKPSVNVKEEIAPAYQLRRYGWTKGLPLSILTDFEEFAVYDCRIKPNEKDKASVARINYLRFDEYEAKWDEIASIFSRDAILKGSFDKYADSTKAKRGTATVDSVFLEDIENWRLELAKNIALRNPTISTRELNYAVQITIDRIIFLRMCEARGIEPYGQLRDLLDDTEIYKELCKLYRKADQRYNSGLFHFEKEPGRADFDSLTPKLHVDDKVLKGIIQCLYYPERPYEFSVMPAEILGQVYEQFLGKVIRLTEGHQAKVEEKPEVKKAGGVYYTPTYIVDYIVKQTVGKLLDDKTPKQAAKLSVLDPACGSGSFLLGAYEFLLKWHLDYYMANGPEKFKKEIVQTPGGWRLTTAERKRILMANIYGVDIDPQAVEVTKLSLLLKVLEGESQESLNQQLRIAHERALPDLAGNIKCGNSLIGPDFYSGQQGVMFDEKEKYRINVFDWNTGFPAIMKAGGFDAVIGNPPYVRIQALKQWAPAEVESYKSQFESARIGNYDIYVVFIERGLSLLNERGRLGYICPHKFFNSQYGAGIRNVIARGKHLSQVVHFGDQQVFSTALTYTCLLFLNKAASSHFEYASIIDVKSWPDNGIRYQGRLRSTEITEQEWNFQSGDFAVLIRRLNGIPVRLKDVALRIFQGLITGADSVFIVENRESDNYYSPALDSVVRLDKSLLHPLCKGSVNIRRYRVDEITKSILFPYHTKDGKAVLIDSVEMADQYPTTWQYLRKCQALLQSREGGKWHHRHWYAFSRSQNLDQMDQVKIMTPSIAKTASFVLDNGRNYYFVGSGGGGGGGYGIIVRERMNIDYRYLLGLLNSKLLDQYLKAHSTPFANGYYAYNRQYIENLPIRMIDEKAKIERQARDRVIDCVRTMLQAHAELAAAKTPHEKAVLQAQIDATDRQIDQLVYELYGLTEEEIKIVEEAPVQR